MMVLKWLIIIAFSANNLVQASINSTDYGNYCDFYVRDTCGHVCVDEDVTCTCGGSHVAGRGNLWRDGRQCCASAADSCTVTDVDHRGAAAAVTCSNATVLGLADMCNSKCYNSYTEDGGILYKNAHFPCPNQCVPIWDICQGVNFCEADVEVCSKDLRCPYDRRGRTKYNLTDTEIVHGHHFCRPVNLKPIANNGQYDLIDRSDEDDLKIKNKVKRKKINFDELQLCEDPHSGSPGVLCGKDCYTSQVSGVMFVA